MKGTIKFIAGNFDLIKDVGTLVLALVFMMSSSARGAIAAVNDILKGGVEMTDDQALQKASDLMGKKFPFIPESLRKMVIQWLFDSMKNTVKKKK